MKNAEICTLSELLAKHGVSRADFCVDDSAGAGALLFYHLRDGRAFPEAFFLELASRLGLRYVTGQRLHAMERVAQIMPYPVLRRNLFILTSVRSDGVTVVTANPYNHRLFAELERIFRRPVEVTVAAPSSIAQAIDEGFSSAHSYRALNELIDRLPEESAYGVLSRQQKFFLGGCLALILICALFSPRDTLVYSFAIVNIVYFLLNPVKFYICLRGLAPSRKQINITDAEVRAIDEAELPSYSILVPLYGEAGILPQILKNIWSLDYPKEKLDVKILMEESDAETLAAARRLGMMDGKPQYVPEGFAGDELEKMVNLCHTVIVPDADIKTKPRACNYGLQRSVGEYCVIYDAEDAPAPDQLKKAVLAFKKLGPEYVCLQSHLNFYNVKQNTLTAWFSVEYGFWFDFFLPGLDQVGAPLPLGGTSNHFRSLALRELGGWDPYNVTEDADLGIRIGELQKKTAMLNSITYEEANSKFWNWVRQRSRWIKGFIQTYFVHMRHPRRLLSRMGLREFMFFQLTFAGNFLLPLINPFLWLVTICYLAGIRMPLYASPFVAQVCIFNLIVGNLFYIAIHVISCIKRREYALLAEALLIPIYWTFVSIGAWKGAIQLITKPFYWEKTHHGLSNANGTAAAA